MLVILFFSIKITLLLIKLIGVTTDVIAKYKDDVTKTNHTIGSGIIVSINTVGIDNIRKSFKMVCTYISFYNRRNIQPN